MLSGSSDLFVVNALTTSIASTVILGCVQTKSEVDVKSVDINPNITGRLEVVITDARQRGEIDYRFEPETHCPARGYRPARNAMAHFGQRTDSPRFGGGWWQ